MNDDTSDSSMNVDSPQAALLSRRSLLHWCLAVGAYGTARPLLAAAQPPRRPKYADPNQPINPAYPHTSGGPQRQLVCVFAKGGVRSADCFFTGPDVETRWTSIEQTIAPGWTLPGPGAALAEVSSKIGVLTGINMESASHAIAQILAMTGYRQSRSIAGPILAANNLVSSTGAPIDPFSLSFAESLYSDERVFPPLAGEPNELALLFQDPDFTGHANLNQLLRSLINEGNESYARQVTTDSRFLLWKRLDDEVDDIVVSNVGGRIYEPSVVEAYRNLETSNPDPSDPTNPGTQAHSSAYDLHATRFACAYSAIKNRVARVVTLSLEGFDSHQGNQHVPGAELSTLLSRLIQDLSTAPGQTMVLLTSDFDRTPQYNGIGGTDHHPIGPVLIAGDGVPSGVIHADGYLRRDVWRSVLDWLGIDGGAFFPEATQLFAP